MSDVNLATYFRGTLPNHKCPECPKDYGSIPELKKHLWTHREADAGGLINQDDRRQKCPHLACKRKTFAPTTSINVHFLTHTGKKVYICPHLSAWAPGQTKLCGYGTNNTKQLTDHRRRIHEYDDTSETAIHPWVDVEDTTLSAAELHFGNPIVKVEGDQEDGVVDANADNDQQPPPVQPPELAPINAQGPLAPENDVNDPAQAHPPAPPHAHNQHAGPAHPHPHLHNGFIPGIPPHMGHHPHHMLAIPREGESFEDVTQTFRCYRSVPSGQFWFHPYRRVYIELPRYEVGVMRRVGQRRRVQAQPVHPPNNA